MEYKSHAEDGACCSKNQTHALLVGSNESLMEFFNFFIM